MTKWIFFFQNSFDPGEKIKPEQLHRTCYAAKMYASVKKKGLCQALFGFRHISSVYNLFLNTTILYCGLKFMLVDGGINSEHIGINNIMFNYSYHSILATEYEELKTKMQPL